MNGASSRFSKFSVPVGVRDRLVPLLDDIVAGVSNRLPYSERSVRSLSLQLLAWCVREGIDPAVNSAFHPDAIDRFCVHECAHLAPGTRLNYQSQLRRIGAELLGAPLYPPRTAAFRSSATCAPYSEEEVAAILAWIRGLPSKQIRDGIETLVQFGLGTGITSAELTHLRSDDIVVDAHGVALRVRGSRARQVPVRRRWEQRIAAAGQNGQALVLMPGRNAVSTKDISRLIERCPVHGVPKVSTQRLRVTWIVALLSASVPLHVVAHVAGASANQVSDYTRHLPLPTKSAIRTLVRGV